jgi:hypothetical protein
MKNSVKKLQKEAEENWTVSDSLLVRQKCLALNPESSKLTSQMRAVVVVGNINQNSLSRGVYAV